jgi:hypothetical protein
MISKEYGKFTLICDICGAAAEEEYETFQDAVDAKKDNGWQSQRINGDRVDICPDCLELD